MFNKATGVELTALNAACSRYQSSCIHVPVKRSHLTFPATNLSCHTFTDVLGERTLHRGLAPMESHERMDEFTLSAEQRQDDNGGAESDGGGGSGATCDRGRGRNSSSGGLSLDSSHQLSASQPIGGGYKPRYTIAPEHVGIAARAKEMEALRSDCVRRRRDYEAQSQWRAARGAAPSAGVTCIVRLYSIATRIYESSTGNPPTEPRMILKQPALYSVN